MRIIIETDQTVRLGDAENFKDFRIVARTRANDLSLVGEALKVAGAGAIDASHGWILGSWLEAQGADESWRRSLSQMMTFAQSKGWTNPGGALRAHVEWPSS